MIVRNVLGGPKRFIELKKSIDGVSPNSLTKKLRDLEKHSVITRTIFTEIPPRVEYQLTAYGQKLENVIASLAEWGALNHQRLFNYKSNNNFVLRHLN